MSGSGMNLQTLLPVKTGEAVQRGVSLRRSDQSFAAVFEKKIQVRQEQSTPSSASGETRRQPVTGQERQEDAKPVEKSDKADKAAKNNPAKEKLKELMKKAKAALDAMKDPEIAPEQLKELAETLKSVLGEIKALVESLEVQIPVGESVQTDNPELLQLIESMGLAKANGDSKQAATKSAVPGETGSEHTGTVNKTEHHDNRQAPELKGNPLLKDLEKVIETQADLIAADPELKEALKQVLTEIKAIQDIEVTKPDIQFSEKLGNLLSQLNGVVVKASEIKNTDVKTAADAIEESASVTAEPVDSEAAVKPVAPAETAETKTDTQKQDAPTEDQSQPDLSQGKQDYQAKIPAEAQDKESSDKGRVPAVKGQEALESISAAPKTTTQAPLQTVQNPQAFQDTLDAVKEGVQAKTQFQSRIMEQVVETVKMNVRADDGKSEMIMKLKPESLGNVALKVSIEKGIVLAEFQVDSQAVKQALESNLQDLRNALQDKGFNVFDLDVSVRKDNQQQQNSGSGQGFKNRSARLENSLERMEQRIMSLESAHRESTIDYLG